MVHRRDETDTIQPLPNGLLQTTFAINNSLFLFSSKCRLLADPQFLPGAPEGEVNGCGHARGGRGSQGGQGQQRGCG